MRTHLKPGKKRVIFLISIGACLLTVLSGNMSLDGYPSSDDKTIQFIKDNQNEDGGWGYWPGLKSYTEPTGLCLQALKFAGIENGLMKGLEYLKKCQLDSGGIGINENDKEGNWMSYAALLAFNALGASEEKERLKQWILDFTDGFNDVPPELVKSTYEELRYDMTIDGWPWFGSTNSWIEPTSLFIIALTQSGVGPQNKRVSSGIKLLKDRTNKNGGWNYGNPFVKNTYLDAFPLPTSIALVAMGITGHTEETPEVKRAIDFLDQCIGEEMSTVNLAWTLLAFKSYGTTQGKAKTVAIILKNRQMADGSFRRNLFETALSYLALSDFRFNRDRYRN
jgi:hypothetical protein